VISEKTRLRLLSKLIMLATSLVGLGAFVYPFFSSQTVQSAARNQAHTQDAPLMTIVLITLCLGAILATLSTGEMNAKMVAVLGILTAVNAVLRAVPGPAGFAAVFALPILCGYVYGGVFGFLLSALSLLVSALIGAGMGPWLPFQMFAAGWVGLSSSWLPKLERWPKVEVGVLGFWGLLWGLLFGAIMNIWFWPFVFQPSKADIYWQPGLGLLQSLRHYAAFYLVSSLWWDLGRGLGNAILIWVFGTALLKLLRRFRKRFHFMFVEQSLS